VVVTGASAGVGRAVVRALGDRGDAVGLVARGRDGLEHAAKEVESRGGVACVAPADVADPDEVEAAASRVESELGPIDVWVNVAMTSVFAPFTEVDPEDFRRVTEVTYLGQVNGTRAALRRMVPRDSGVVVQVGSALAYRGIPLQSAYCGAKHAVVGFTESVRTELMHDKSSVRVSMVHLPGMNTPQFRTVKSKMPHEPQPVPPIYQPEVAARAVVWATEHARRQVYVASSTVGTILGNRVLGGLLDRYLGRTGYSSQQTDERHDPGRPDNLRSPVPGDQGAHGVFDDQAKPSSLELSLSLHRGRVAGAAGTAALAAGLGAAALLRRRGR